MSSAETDAELARQVVCAARRMYELRLVSGSAGNVSARVGQGMLITPTRRYYDEIEVRDLVVMPLGHHDRPAGTAPSLEWRMHASIYRARPDARAIVHTHSCWATARSFDSRPLLFNTEERAYLGMDRLPVVPAHPGGSADLAVAVATELEQHDAALLARHGVVVLGDTPRDAAERAAAIEHQAQLQWILEVGIPRLETDHS